MGNRLKDIFYYIWKMNAVQTQMILAIVIFVMMLLVIVSLIYLEIPERNENVLFTLLGLLGSSFVQVVSYYFGSSKGSSEKNEIIQRQNNTADKDGVGGAG